MENNPIIEKIRKLQALADRAGTEAEAAAAAARVAQLCHQHNIELGSVAIAQEETSASERAHVHGGNLSAHLHWLRDATEKLFNVGAYKYVKNVPIRNKQGFVVDSKRETHMVFYGLRANVESAVLSYQYLIASVESLLSGYLSEGHSLGADKGRSYRMGCAHRIAVEAEKQAGIVKRMLEGNTEHLAIVRVQNALLVQHAKDKKLRSAGSSVRGARSSSAYAAGYAAGGRVDLHGARSNRMLN